MTLGEIATYLSGELNGPSDLEIKGPAKIELADPEEITFLSNPKYAKFLLVTRAGAIIIDDNVKEHVSIPYIKVKNAYFGFLQLLKLFMPADRSYLNDRSDPSYIDPTAQIDEGVKIGPVTYVGPGVHVGKNTILYPGVILLKNVRIGEDCILYPNVSVREECIIGNRVIIHNGCVVGSDGFGFAPNGEKYEKIPQLGRVRIHDDVEIGANVTIDRATIGETIIKSGTKIDNLVQIAHNVIIGENSILVAQGGISGSTEIGKHVTIGGQVGIVGHIKIGDHSMIAAQSGVTKDVPEKTVMFGTPALPIMHQKRIDVSIKKLPEMIKKIHHLETAIAILKKRLDEYETSESR